MVYNAKRPIIYISINGGRKKIYNEKNVYLKDEELFDVEIYNPFDKPIKAMLNINGALLRLEGVIIRPNENMLFKNFIYDSKSDNKFNGLINVSLYEIEEIEEIDYKPTFINHGEYPSYNFPPSCNQDTNTVYKPSYEFNPVYKESLQILKDTKIPLDKKDLKIYCHRCGKKCKHKDKYCSLCGTVLYK